MKNRVLFSAVCIALLSLSLVSCEKKEKVFSPVGTWDLIMEVYDVYTNGELTKQQFLNADEVKGEMMIIFGATGRIAFTVKGKTTSGLYSFNDDFSALILTDDKETNVVKVAKASDDTLILCLFDEEYTDENGKQIHEIIKYEFARRK